MDSSCGRKVARGAGGRYYNTAQKIAERRYGDFKEPPAVTPVFVQNNQRVAALVAVICLALLLFCLIEWHVRQALGLGPEQKVKGPYPGDQMVRSTGRMILYRLSGLRLWVGSATRPAHHRHQPGRATPSWNRHAPAGQRPDEAFYVEMSDSDDAPDEDDG